MISDIQQDASARMDKSIESLRIAFAKIRTGRAHPSLLDQISVPYYGSNTPLTQIANIVVEDSRTLAVTPWEQGMVPDVEKAIMKSNMGLNPNSVGNLIRIPLPPLTEERRHDLVKQVKVEAENIRIAIRNIRRYANSAIKEELKDKSVSEDVARKGEEKIKKLTDSFVKEVERLLEVKEADLLSM